jgi:hypothetical protein
MVRLTIAAERKAVSKPGRMGGVKDSRRKGRAGSTRARYREDPGRARTRRMRRFKDTRGMDRSIEKHQVRPG